MKNIGGRDGGSITAAQFLQRFVDKGRPWAHCDIAGTAWSDKPGATLGQGRDRLRRAPDRPLRARRPRRLSGPRPLLPDRRRAGRAGASAGGRQRPPDRRADAAGGGRRRAAGRARPRTVGAMRRGLPRARPRGRAPRRAPAGAPVARRARRTTGPRWSRWPTGCGATRPRRSSARSCSSTTPSARRSARCWKSFDARSEVAREYHALEGGRWVRKL